MQTFIKTSINNNENLKVSSTITSLLQDIAVKHTRYIRLDIINNNGEQSKLVIKKKHIKSITVEL